MYQHVIPHERAGIPCGEPGEEPCGVPGGVPRGEPCEVPDRELDGEDQSKDWAFLLLMVEAERKMGMGQC